MTVSATYMADLNRVRVAFSSQPAAADVVQVERSIDGITWVTVRGGEAVTLSSSAGQLDDYEFVPGVLNTYRVTAVDTVAQSYVGSGGAVTANNAAAVNPSCHASTVVGDLVLLLATVRYELGTPVQPAGWTTVIDHGNVKVFARYATSAGSVAQSVSFTGAGANDDTTGQMATFRNTDISPAGTPAELINASQQNLPWPAATPGSAPSLAVGVGWKQAPWTSAPATSAWTSELGQVSATAGNDAAHVWWYQARTDTTQKAAGSWTITGGFSAVSRAAVAFFPPRVNIGQETTTITPTFTRVWIKNLQRPYMNTELSTPVALLQIEREPRAGIFPIKGRSLPIAVTDLRGGREFVIGALVEDATERDRLNLILNAGEPILLHVPPGAIRLESMYAVIGKTSYDDEASIQWMPLAEVAAPAASVVGTTVLWQDIINTYATWADLIAAKATWADVLNHVGDPSDIITG